MNNPQLPNADITDVITAVVQAAGEVIFGKEQQVKLALCALFSNSHVLLNDLPGVGKTTLAITLAKLSGLDFSRIQFTSDLLPADITGVSIFNAEKQSFSFQPGPIFAGLVLVDEINRATPRTQSALLECMEEKQVSVDGISHALPKPFFVIATQNPTEQIGTFGLPESQLDRFAMQIELGYPNAQAERQILKHGDPREKLAKMHPVLDSHSLSAIQQTVNQCHAADALLDYLQAIIAATRNHPDIKVGYSPRAALSLLKCAKAWATIAGRSHVIPEDIKAVLPSTAHHLSTDLNHQNLVQTLLQGVAVP
ncbi:MAG: MoxR-like ATPase [Saprospiraceae bacterium]|jgi:MoxR-like ATPase